jgi:acyl carrier protein
MAEEMHPAPGRQTSDEEQLAGIIRGLVGEVHPGGASVQVGLDSRLEADLGLDSLAVVELRSRMEEAFGGALPDRILGGGTLGERPPRAIRPAAVNRRSRRRLGSHARAGPSRASIVIQAVSSHAMATSSHQTWFWAKPCSGRPRNPVSFAHRIRSSHRARDVQGMQWSGRCVFVAGRGSCGRRGAVRFGWSGDPGRPGELWSGVVDFEVAAEGGGDGVEVAGVGADDQVAAAQGSLDDACVDDVGGG